MRLVSKELGRADGAGVETRVSGAFLLCDLSLIVSCL